MEKVEFRSEHGHLRLFFDPRRYGRCESDQLMKDQYGQFVIDPKTQDVKKVSRALSLVRFASKPGEPGRRVGTFRVHEATDSTGAPLAESEKIRILEAMRKHPENRANGGGLFFEIGTEAAKMAGAFDGRFSASMPEGGLTADDGEMLTRLEKALGVAVPPPAMAARREDLARALERFRVLNIAMPDQDKGVKGLKTRIAMLMEALEEAGIWPDRPRAAPPTAPDEAA